MKIYRFNYINTPEIFESIALCLGFFDGLHIGHIKLIETAKNSGYQVGVMTFSSSFKKNSKCITTLEDKISLMEKYGVDHLFIVENTLELSSLSAIDFINFVLKKINPKMLICGTDFHFGHFGKGNPDLLKQYFLTEVVDLLPFKDDKISSSLIRNLISEGQLEIVNSLLNRPYKITSRIINGLGNGSSLLFPTINIDLLDYVKPKNGVYFVKFIIDDKKYNAIANIGTHPTINELNEPIAEVFVEEKLDLSTNGASIEILHFHRAEKTFTSIEQLKNQISSDIKEMEKYFKENQ